MPQIKAKLIYNKRIKDNFFRLVLQGLRLAKESSPGQFINIKVNDGYRPLLRRPFSIHRVRGLDIEILCEVVGKGTEILSQRKPGELLDVIGPLGNGFNDRWQLAGSKWPILVAGGMGIAPLLFLAERLSRHKALKQAKRKITVLIGARTESHILCEKEFRQLGCEVRVSTDNGSKGFKGKVTDLLKRELRTTNYEPRAIYACGPKPMLKEISSISKEYNLPAQISLEAHMACGFGACLGCVVNTTQGYKRVCKDGPVFGADEINWAE